MSNEELVRSHVPAIWLAESELYLGSSLMQVLDVEGDHPSLALTESVRMTLAAVSVRE